MADEDPREVLAALCRERREDYSGLSRLLGRNPAYVQQFIKRGSPRRLDEADRRTLADYFGVDEARLGGSARPRGVAHGRAPGRTGGDVLLVPRLDVGASAGPGATPSGEDARGRIGFDQRWLRQLTGAGPAGLSMISVAGDSMEPTLGDGDDILVDTADAGSRLRDGIYVLRVDDALIVKRLALNPVARRITIRSDNPRYPDIPDCDPAGIGVIGRVVWVGRKVT